MQPVRRYSLERCWRAVVSLIPELVRRGRYRASRDVRGAMVTAAWIRADIATRTGYRVLQETEVGEPRAIVARVDGPDPTELLVVLDDAIGALRADGTLTDLARQHFGGEDLSDVSR